MCWLRSRYVSNCWQKLCMYRLYRPLFRLFSRAMLPFYRTKLCSTYRSNFSTKIGYVSFFFDLCFDFLDRCLDFLDLCFESDMSRFLCSTYVSTFSAKIVYFLALSTYVSTSSTSALFWLSWLMFWLSGPKSGMFRLLCSTYFSNFQLKLGMFRIYRPMFWFPRPLFWFSWLMFWLSGPKPGMFLCF